MTSPAEPASNDATPASQLTRPLRELAALVLLGANAVFLFVGLIQLLAPRGSYSTLTGRAGSAFYAFVGMETIALPVLAVLLATHVRPVVSRAKLITRVALVEYAVSAGLGGLSFLIWAVGRLAEAELLDGFLGTLNRLAMLAVFAVAAYVVWTVWYSLYRTVKPKPQPGVYGTPQQGWGQQQPGQPGPAGGWQAPGQYTPPGQPGMPFAGGPPPGAPYGQPSVPQSAPPYGQPSAPPFPTPPQSAPSFPQSPQSAPPFPQSAPSSEPTFQAPPFGQPPSADPTQAIPRQSAEATQAVPRDDADRTQRFSSDDRPDQPR